ncbi:outer membrane assembly protein AsmA [Acerihabitans arboris]|uniref:Outer membrane assembly protein AsmA n=1 Tax=Acerihabitans arboris TaxID=2691583 RepID=A0A845SU71_9GAMM|nr:outer membrane assembly protein AsmA [Acerihabitans arboris]NDL66011.1 outer membrane assembly protein AsmA [Acerihabitans arboris]
MRRFLTTLVILLAVLVAGITALVLLINPNDFRNYMVTKVEQRSGYRLRLDGDLRWHVWPQLSILAGRMTLTAPGAAVPVVSAENMRLDVHLWPLVSHQLSVKQVMLKGAVITITPDSEARRPENAPIAPAGTPEPEQHSGWSYDISSLKVNDSLLIWQREPNEQINLRDFNLDIEQTAARQADITFSSRINRDQRDVAVSLKGKADLSHYPRQLAASLDSFNYELHGPGMSAEGIKGEGRFTADYSATNQTIELGNMAFSANDSQLAGQASAKLGDVPVYQLDLTARRLNLDTLLGITPGGDNDTQNHHHTGKPVIAGATDDHPFSVLNGFNGQLNLSADQVIYHGLNITGFKTQADNRRGHLAINTLGGRLGDGEFSLPGMVDTTGPRPRFELQPSLKQVALGPLLQAFSLPQTLTGQLSVDGQLSGQSFTVEDFAQNWRGAGRMQLDNARLEGLNIQQLIQRAVERSNSSVTAQQRTETYSAVKQLTADATLDQGDLRLNDLAGDSDLMALTGNGVLDLPGRQCDVNLNIRVLKGWQGEPQLTEALIATTIPLRVYGPWDNLSYQLHVDQLLRDRLQDELKKRLDAWAQKNQAHPQNKNVQKLLDKL